MNKHHKLDAGLSPCACDAMSRPADQHALAIEQAVAQSPVSIIVTDICGRIEYANPKFEQITGYTLAEVLGKTPSILKSGHTSDEEYRELWQAIRAGHEWRGEFLNRRKDGTLFWESALISAVRDPNGQVGHFVAVKEDITERKAAEAEALRMQKMDALGTLASGVAHDFNNILTSVLGYGELLRDSLDEHDPRREDAETVVVAAQRGKLLVEQILYYARERRGERKPVEVVGVVREILRLMRASVRPSIGFVSDVQPDAGAVLVDGGQLHQILVNLCRNAADAMAEAGTVQVTVGRIRLDEPFLGRHAVLPPGDYVRLTVKDDGPGIAPDVAPRIFEPFFSTKAQRNGTGLGLAIIDRIVRGCGGHIEVDSTPGQGATFTVLLPRVAEVGPDGQVIEAAMGNGERILVVDDEQPIARMLVRLLSSSGYQAEWTTSAQVALRKVAAGGYDAVMTDHVMPRMTGLALAARLKSRHPQLPVLLCTGAAVDLKGAAVDAVVRKPVVAGEVARALRDLLDQCRAVNM